MQCWALPPTLSLGCQLDTPNPIPRLPAGHPYPILGLLAGHPHEHLHP